MWNFRKKKICKEIKDLVGESFYLKEFRWTSDSKIDWELLFKFHEFSEDFIRSHQDQYNKSPGVWSCISRYQPLSLEFMKEFSEYLNWIDISCCQCLSKKSMEKLEDKLNWRVLYLLQPYIFEKENHRLGVENLKINKLYRIYQETKEQGWFIGYKYKDNPVNSLYFDPLDFKRAIQSNSVLKIKIYWKDLKILTRINKYEPIREIKLC